MFYVKSVTLKRCELERRRELTQGLKPKRRKGHPVTLASGEKCAGKGAGRAAALTGHLGKQASRSHGQSPACTFSRLSLAPCAAPLPPQGPGRAVTTEPSRGLLLPSIVKGAA